MSFIPFLVLIVLITCCVTVFGNATLDGASQVSLMVASAVSVLVGHFSKRLKWENLEKEVTDKIASCTPAIIILLLIGAIGGTWMVSGIVPTIIYYGMQIIRPEVFLVSSSLLCALVSLMIGSSWTTVATIGLALSRLYHYGCLFWRQALATFRYHCVGFQCVWHPSVYAYPLYALHHGAYVLHLTYHLSDCRIHDGCVWTWLRQCVYGGPAAHLRYFSLVTHRTCVDGRHDFTSLAFDGGAFPGYPSGCRCGLAGTV